MTCQTLVMQAKRQSKENIQFGIDIHRLQFTSDLTNPLKSRQTLQRTDYPVAHQARSTPLNLATRQN